MPGDAPPNYADWKLSEAMEHAAEHGITITVGGLPPSVAAIAVATIKSIESTQDSWETGRTVGVILYPFEKKDVSGGRAQA